MMQPIYTGLDGTIKQVVFNGVPHNLLVPIPLVSETSFLRGVQMDDRF